MKISFLVLLLQGIPEQISTAYLAYVLAKKTINFKRVVILGIIMATSAFIVRLLPITFGVHTVILIGILFYYLRMIEKIEIRFAIMVSLLTFLVLIIFESLFVPFLMYLYNVSKTQMLENDFLRILITLPHVFALFLFSYTIQKIRKDRCC